MSILSDAKKWTHSFGLHTGISARNIRGMTLHAFAGIGVGYSDREELMKKSMHPAGMPFIHPLIHSSIHSFTHPLIHSFTHSLNYDASFCSTFCI
jgi:hypothetical protein